MRILVFALSAMLVIESCSQCFAKSKILIAYFSLDEFMSEGADAVSGSTPYIGNTHTAAKNLQALTGGDIFRITTSNNYPVRHVDASKTAKKELDADSRPELTSHVENMSQYYIIFVGFPIWWYREPMIIRSFLEEYDFSGKVIAPFCTSMAVNIEQSMKDIREICPSAEVREGLRMETEQEDFTAPLRQWLNRINLGGNS